LGDAALDEDAGEANERGGRTGGTLRGGRGGSLRSGEGLDLVTIVTVRLTNGLDARYAGAGGGVETGNGSGLAGTMVGEETVPVRRSGWIGG
jgi:hypothetical protein